MAGDVIDFVLQTLVERDILQGIPTWELLRDYLERECMMAPERLDARRAEIGAKFLRCKQEQLEKASHDLMGTTSNKTTTTSTDRASLDQVIPQSAGVEQRPNQTKDLGSKGEATFHPKIVEMLSVSGCLKSTFETKKYSSFPTQTDATQSEGRQSESACFMSICLPNGKWEGAALKYCQKEESYVSQKIIGRHKLEKEISEDGRIRLTWRLYGEEGTNVTQFTVHDSLPCDFMLGTRRFDEEFNRDDSSEDDEDAESASSTFLQDTGLLVLS
jgi:hypothetical protein